MSERWAPVAERMVDAQWGGSSYSSAIVTVHEAHSECARRIRDPLSVRAIPARSAGIARTIEQ